MLGIDVSKKSKKKKEAWQFKEKKKEKCETFFLSSPDRPLPFPQPFTPEY